MLETVWCAVRRVTKGGVQLSEAESVSPMQALEAVTLNGAYQYFEEGDKGTTRFIRGRLHTVRPIALEQVPVFTENCRACTEIVTERFGTLTQIEVGAMLVGRICNLHSGECHVLRGEEKGCFQYGGSTVMLLVERDAIAAPEALLDATANGVETPVRIGEAVAIGDKDGIKG